MWRWSGVTNSSALPKPVSAILEAISSRELLAQIVGFLRGVHYRGDKACPLCLTRNLAFHGFLLALGAAGARLGAGRLAPPGFLRRALLGCLTSLRFAGHCSLQPVVVIAQPSLAPRARAKPVIL